MVSYTTKRLLESITARDPASGEARHRRAMPCCYPTALSESHLQRLRHLGIEYTEQWGSHRDRHVRWTDLPGAGNDMYPELPPTTPATRR